MNDGAREQAVYGHNACAMCSKRDYVRPLHGEKGGPMCCLLCLGKWHAEHGRQRRLGRIVIRAIAAYVDGGGKPKDIDELKACAFGRSILGFSFDPLGYLVDTADTKGETIDLTSELLVDAIKLAHPDLHPPERQELAHRVTQGLLALQPFVFPAPKPKPVTPGSPAPKPAADTKPQATNKSTYPCTDCKSTTPKYYCDPCRAEWDKRQQQERDREQQKRDRRTAKQRAAHTRRRKRILAKRPPKHCASCGKEFNSKRDDAIFCSARCRQQAHRHRAPVTDKSRSTREPLSIRDAQAPVTGKSRSRGVTLFKRDAERLILTALKHHPVVFLNDILPPDRTGAQYQALCRASRALEDAGEIETFSYWTRWRRPGFMALVRPGVKPERDGAFDPDKIVRLTPEQRHALATAAQVSVGSAAP